MNSTNDTMRTILNIGGAYILAFAAVMAVNFARGYMINSMDAGDGDSANMLMIFCVLFGIVPAALLLGAALSEIQNEEYPMSSRTITTLIAMTIGFVMFLTVALPAISDSNDGKFFLRNGSRAMGGNLDMGGNTIKNLGAGLTFDSLDLEGGTIDGTVIGGTTPAAGTFTTLIGTAGTIDGATIGGSTPGAGTFTTLTVDNTTLNADTLSTSVGDLTLSSSSGGDVLLGDGSTILYVDGGTNTVGIGITASSDRALNSSITHGDAGNSTRYGIIANSTAHQAGGSGSAGNIGLVGDAVVAADNDSNWTNAVSIRGVQSSTRFLGGSGTITGSADFYATNPTVSGVTLTTAYGMYFEDLTTGSNNWEIGAAGDVRINANVGIRDGNPQTALSFGVASTISTDAGDLTLNPADELVISQAVDMNIQAGDYVTWTGSTNLRDTEPETHGSVSEWVMSQVTVTPGASSTLATYGSGSSFSQMKFVVAELYISNGLNAVNFVTVAASKRLTDVNEQLTLMSCVDFSTLGCFVVIGDFHVTEIAGNKIRFEYVNAEATTVSIFGKFTTYN
jgi:hypothetical protein